MPVVSAFRRGIARVGRALVRAVPGDEDAVWGLGHGVQSATGVRITQETAMACDAVMACVSLLAEDVAKLPPRLMRRLADRSRQIAADHPLFPLLATPNAWQTWQEFVIQMMAGLLLRGNGYAVIVRDGRGDPRLLVPVNPDQVAIWLGDDGAVFYRVNRGNAHERAVLRHEPLLIPARDVFHLKGLSSGGLLGLSKIALNREAIGLAIAQEQQAARWMGQAARPSGVLQTDKKMSPETIAKLRGQWEEMQGGIIRTGRPAILEEGLKWQPMGLTGQDLEFIASRTFQLNSVARLWRVPPHMIGELTKATNNSLTQLSQEYVNFTLSTYTTIWSQRAAKTFDLPDDVSLSFDLSVLLRGDITARYANYRVGAQGWLTVNEIRDAEGLDPVEDGDVIFRPVNMAPLGSDVFAANAVDPSQPGIGSEQGGENPDAGNPHEDAPSSSSKF